MRKRKIRKIGGSLFIPLSKSDLEDFGLVEGDLIDIDDLNLLQMAKSESELTQEEKDGSMELGNTQSKSSTNGGKK